MNVELATALVAFRSEAIGIPLDGLNPHFHSRFSTLSAIHKVIDPLLHAQGLTIIQFPINVENKIGVKTILLHKGGGFLEGDFVLPLAKQDPQGGGAAISYARRYGISAVLGLVTEEDDDAESAVDRRAAVRAPTRDKNPRKQSTKKDTRLLDDTEKTFLKGAAADRIKELGDESINVQEVIKAVAKKMGLESPHRIKSIALEEAVKIIAAWEPGK